MGFLKHFARCAFLAFGVLALLKALLLLPCIPRDRARLATMRQAHAILQKYRAYHDSLPAELSLHVPDAKGRDERISIHVLGWLPIDWSRPRNSIKAGPFEETADKFLLGYSIPSNDWMDYLDSTTGKTSLDSAESPLAVLRYPGASLFWSAVCFYAARRLRRA